MEGVIIAGPTASGKSAAALEIAAALDGEIVNADAMQIYRELPILTASPSAVDRAQIPHHLYNCVPGEERWSAGLFARKAAALCDDILARGRRPIVVGGTGLWLKALTDGLSPIPPIDDSYGRAAAARWAQLGPEDFRREVLNLDPAMEALAPADRQRHLRAWTVATATGTPLSEWQRVPPTPVLTIEWARGVLMPDRETLRTRSAHRFAAMVERGAMGEVAALLARDLSLSLPIMKAVGVRELSKVLAGEWSLEEGVSAAVTATHRLVKRQTTWFNNQFSAWPQSASANALNEALGGGQGRR
ncbi:tRNA delta(2)-isopentenylpyrophosphate transferase [Parvularcula bermudensis HTCC2503]|uniref:tRNA dimethylallyltransferase n=1 Tax=Parvularcula bermudensis (strain ATCC BAA-594 / HTCC2503 / KCTC 12087) TaxID=314260 RepID=E0TB24_PARBH|nr:tRNA (adenosine(37)-N6)-dimethylallyltransferase MiaA [Parvularcula bermudensis]ADM08233.1 tRNA delta(2)-isopentenylpyrophosphate transferase [Parvularcula bermudensis HTCC2503]